MPDLGIQPDPDELRRNLAITLGSQPPVLSEHLGMPAGPQMAAPGPIDMPDTSKAPNLAITPPAVKGPRGTLDADKAERTRLLTTGPGESQIYGKVTGSEFGQHHPLVGKILGGLGQVGATLGDIGLSAVAPGIAAAIPGTAYHHAQDVRGVNKQIGAEEGEAHTEAQTGAEQAQTAHTQAETAGMPAEQASRQGLEAAQTENLNSEVEQRKEPTLAAGYAHAVNEAIKAGRDPSTDPIVQHLSDAITSLQKQPATPPGTKTVQLEVGGKPHQVLVDERTGETVKDLGESGEKPPVVRVDRGETPGEQRSAKNDLLKAYQPTLDSAERMNVMTESYEKAVKDHDQQAMLNLLANHLGMTMGLQKGARLTKDIIREAQQSQPWLQGLAAKFDKDGYLAGVTLSPNQMRQMVALGQSRYAEDAKKSRSTAQYLGAKDDGPERIPGKATMRYYLGQTNGDATKAKELAAQDGWTVNSGK